MRKYRPMQDFLEFAAKYDPTYPSRVEGATKDEIDRLTNLVGCPLPGAYREYLQVLGHKNGGISLLHTAWCDVKSVLEDAEDPEGPPVGFLQIGAGGTTLQSGFLLLNGEADPPVFYGEETTPRNRYADSFQKLLYRATFESLYVRKRPCWSVYLSTNKQQILEDLNTLLLQQGFDIHWFSDSIATCAESPSVALAVHHLQNDWAWCYLGALTSQEHDRISNLLLSRFPFRLEDKGNTPRNWLMSG